MLNKISELKVGNCSCSSYISESGAGLCRTSYIQGPICYVNEPSTCEDLHVSSIEDGKRYSWEACKNGTFNFQYLFIWKMILIKFETPKWWPFGHEIFLFNRSITNISRIWSLGASKSF